MASPLGYASANRSRRAHFLQRNFAQMIQSMTGYATASADSARGRLSLELRTVNARFLDLTFRVAEELRSLEPLLREAIGARLSRGKVDCRFYFNESAGVQLAQRLDAAALARLKALSEEARKAFPEAGARRVADVLRWPGVAPRRRSMRSSCATSHRVFAGGHSKIWW